MYDENRSFRDAAIRPDFPPLGKALGAVVRVCLACYVACHRAFALLRSGDSRGGARAHCAPRLRAGRGRRGQSQWRRSARTLLRNRFTRPCFELCKLPSWRQQSPAACCRSRTAIFAVVSLRGYLASDRLSRCAAARSGVFAQPTSPDLISARFRHARPLSDARCLRRSRYGRCVFLRVPRRRGRPERPVRYRAATRPGRLRRHKRNFFYERNLP